MAYNSLLTSSRKPVFRTAVRLTLHLEKRKIKTRGQWPQPSVHLLKTFVFPSGILSSHLPRKSSLSRSLSKTSMSSSWPGIDVTIT